MSQPLKPKSKLGRYEIVSQLGAGGMGVVYLARDTRLERKVALKILPPDLAMKQERMARFVREAKAAAALNHPNIAHIYEIGEQDEMHFIVMEYVDGKTLREKIHFEHTDLRKLVKYLQQVASGLAKAHAAGIVHRDLKPDNIMITRDGYAKILDFGLAKLIEPAGLNPSETAASDIATVEWEQHSLPGKLLGTVGYMSPEQAQGKVNEIDHRSDIFSFGCLLYEAIAGQRPFQGESKVQSLYRLVYEPPPPLGDLNPNAPPELQRIVRRCLAKDPDERYQSIQDVSLELKELRRDLEGGSQMDITMAPSAIASTLEPTTPPPSTATLDAATVTSIGTHTTSSAEVILSEIKQHKRTVFLVSVGGLLAIALIVGLWLKFPGTSSASPFSKMKITRLTTGGKIGGATIKGYTSISSDGKYVVFRTTEAGKDSLWVRQVSTGSLVEIVPDHTGKIGGTTFSSDGEFVYYSSFDTDDPLGTLYKVPVLGGRSQKIMPGVTSPISFSPDGKQFAFVRPSSAESSIYIANVDGSNERKIATRKLPEYYSFGGGPDWSPDGKTIACGAGAFSGSSSGTVVTVPVSGGAEKTLGSERWVLVSRALWMKDNSGLIVAAVPELSSEGTQLWFVSYPSGDVRRITNDLNAYGTTSLGVTGDSKTIVTIQAEREAQVWVVPASGDVTNAKQVTQGKYDGESLAWTGDNRILYTASSGEHIDVWSVNADGASNSQQTGDAFIEGLGCATPDGRSVVFSSNRSGNLNIWKMTFGQVEQQPLTHGKDFDSQPICSPDGRWVLFRSFRQGKSTYWRVSIDGGEPQQLLDRSSSWAAISPDGKLVAIRYFDDAKNVNRIAVIPFGGGEAVATLDVPLRSRDIGLSWTGDSRAIIYAESQDNADNLWTAPLDGSPAKQLTKFNSGLIFAFQMSSDGKQIALSRGRQTDDVILIRDGD